MPLGKDNKEEATVSKEAEQNKTLVRRLFEARGKLDMDALEKMLAPHFLSHTTRVLPGQPLDREAYKRTTLEYHAAFSNTSFIFEEQVAEADKVVSRISGRATHDRKEFLGVAPTGRVTSYNAIFIHRISGGESAWSRSLRWHEVSSKPPCPRRCPPWRAGRLAPSTSQPGR